MLVWPLSLHLLLGHVVWEIITAIINICRRSKKLIEALLSLLPCFGGLLSSLSHCHSLIKLGLWSTC